MQYFIPICLTHFFYLFIWNPVRKREVIWSTIFKNYEERIGEKNYLEEDTEMNEETIKEFKQQ